MNAITMQDAIMRGVHDQTNLGFVVNQTAHIEAQVIEKIYPELNYAADVPVDLSANGFAKSVTYYSGDKVGQAKLMNGHGDDIPLANVDLEKFETQVYMAGIGYSFSLEEVGQAQMLGMNLDAMGAMSADYAYQKFMDDVTYVGNDKAGFTGLYNSAAVTIIAAGGVWSGRTPQQILVDFNAMITGPFTETNGTMIPNTVRLPLAVIADISSRQIAPESQMTILEYLQAKNVYTAQTGQRLDIRGDYRLTNRAVAYRRDERVLKLHVPMALRFLPVQPRNLEYFVPGMFRTGGLDIRLPAGVRYLDGVA